MGGMANRARSAARRSSAFSTPPTKRITVRPARPAASCSPIAACHDCSRTTGPSRSTSSSGKRLAFGLRKLRLRTLGLRRRRLGLDLALEGKAISEIVVCGVVRAREKRTQSCCVMRFALTDLDVRERAIGALRKISMPEVDVPSHELVNPLETVRIGAPVFFGQCDVSPIDRDAFLRADVAITVGDLSKQPWLDQHPARAHHAGAARP